MNILDRSLHRRGFLRGAALASAGVMTGAVPLSGTPVSGRARPNTPNEALDRLIEGNRRFVDGEGQELNRSMMRIKELADGQSPYAAILSCADSRVPPELLFDQGFGDVFTVRVAGNVSGTEELASLEYAVAVLGSQVVMVLGHTSCGAVGAAMGGGEVPGQISSLYRHIRPAIRNAGSDVGAAVIANVRYQADILRTASPVMADAIADGRLAVVGGVYDLSTGVVDLVDEG